MSWAALQAAVVAGSASAEAVAKRCMRSGDTDLEREQAPTNIYHNDVLPDSVRALLSQHMQSQGDAAGGGQDTAEASAISPSCSADAQLAANVQPIGQAQVQTVGEVASVLEPAASALVGETVAAQHVAVPLTVEPRGEAAAVEVSAPSMHSATASATTSPYHTPRHLSPDMRIACYQGLVNDTELGSPAAKRSRDAERSNDPAGNSAIGTHPNNEDGNSAPEGSGAALANATTDATGDAAPTCCICQEPILPGAEG